jgi:hypothetical protein
LDGRTGRGGVVPILSPGTSRNIFQTEYMYMTERHIQKRRDPI